MKWRQLSGKRHLKDPLAPEVSRVVGPGETFDWDLSDVTLRATCDQLEPVDAEARARWKALRLDEEPEPEEAA